MWIDLNSAFATAEQQAHPSLRGKPIAVTNRLSPECCMLAVSYEGKALGIKTGMRRSEALKLYPTLVVLETDPPKYRYIYERLFALLREYAPFVQMKSIDEGVIDFSDTPLAGNTAGLVATGHKIKERVRQEIGDYITINIGIAPNRFLAKTAANLHKPDGLDVIDADNVLQTYASLELEDLTGIAAQYGKRLRGYDITTPLEFAQTDKDTLEKLVFRSSNGVKWYKRLRGYEVDAEPTNLTMIGRQWVVHQPTSDEEYLRSCLHFLTETVGIKLRFREKAARGVCIWLRFRGGGGWQLKHLAPHSFYTNDALWEHAEHLFAQRPKHMVVQAMGIYTYKFEALAAEQTSLLRDIARQAALSKAGDVINNRYGRFAVVSADSLQGRKLIKQKIPFGGTAYFDLLINSR